MMNRWTNKYSYGPTGVANTPARALGGRLRSVLLVVLLVAVVVLGVWGGQAIVYQSRCEPTFVSNMLTECDSAITTANTLSRSGGAESAAILGRIRANIRAIDVINEVNNSIEGGNGYFVPTAVFTELYGIIDSYSNNLKLGNVTIEDQNNLVNALANLGALLDTLR